MTAAVEIPGVQPTPREGRSAPNTNFVLPLRVLDAGQIQALRAIVADVRVRGLLGAGVD
ncbi:MULTISPECIES: hypothetical protein [unclassified Brevundimonas]|uniref:hypothetical protein n=1 Tax=unclassified Brevundimonas TaxID=2622653 RepID=UPI0020039E30|nr:MULTISPECIES: hypothetical protein [unclassified Brevundimonas]MCK6104799.1 hypothetical protein [Brevundimonas sp. EYE_349]